MNKKPFECKAEGCNKSYCDARSLRRHTEHHHTGSKVNAAVLQEAGFSQSLDSPGFSEPVTPTSTSLLNMEPVTPTSAGVVILSCSNSTPEAKIKVESPTGGESYSQQQHNSVHLSPTVTSTSSTSSATASSVKLTTTTTVHNQADSKSPTQHNHHHHNHHASQENRPKQERSYATQAGDGNEGLTAEQLALIQQIMEQTRRAAELVSERHGSSASSTVATAVMPTNITVTARMATSIPSGVAATATSITVLPPPPPYPSHHHKSPSGQGRTIVLHSSPVDKQSDKVTIQHGILSVPPKIQPKGMEKKPEADSVTQLPGANALSDLLQRRLLKRAQRILSDPGDDLSIQLSNLQVPNLSLVLGEELSPSSSPGTGPHTLSLSSHITDNSKPPATKCDTQLSSTQSRDQRGKHEASSNTSNEDAFYQTQLSASLLSEVPVLNSEDLQGLDCHLDMPHFQTEVKNESTSSLMNLLQEQVSSHLFNYHDLIESAAQKLQAENIDLLQAFEESTGQHSNAAVQFPNLLPLELTDGDLPNPDLPRDLPQACLVSSTTKADGHPVLSPLTKSSHSPLQSPCHSHPSSVSSVVPSSSHHFSPIPSPIGQISQGKDDKSRASLPGSVSAPCLRLASPSPSPMSTHSLPETLLSYPSSPPPTSSLSWPNVSSMEKPHGGENSKGVDQMMSTAPDLSSCLSAEDLDELLVHCTAARDVILNMDSNSKSNTRFHSTSILPDDTDFLLKGDSRSKHMSESDLFSPQDPLLHDATGLSLPMVKIEDNLGSSITSPKMEVSYDNDDVFLSPSSIASTLQSVPVLKASLDPLPILSYPSSSVTSTSISRCTGSGHRPVNSHRFLPQPYTPPPMLNSSRQLVSSSMLSSSNTSVATASMHISVTQWKRQSSTVIDCLGDEAMEPSSSVEGDVEPHINIGSSYQAIIPPCCTEPGKVNKEEEKGDLLWSPIIEERHCSRWEVDRYLKFASNATSPAGGCGVEYALHILCICVGNIRQAMLYLLQPCPPLPVSHPLPRLAHRESDRWTPQQMAAFKQALSTCHKDFRTIAAQVPGKSVAQCVQYYYLWKKICREEYFSLLKRRKPTLNVFSRTASHQEYGQRAGCTNQEMQQQQQPECADSQPPPQRTLTLNAQLSISGPLSPGCDGSSSSHASEYPCKTCGKIFNKVRSRSAHMKCHRPSDAGGSEPKKPKLERISLDSFL
ncbi:unnamed protein product [Darwinula stevensoni]|uniref:Uncharacterized protein n=1 Tax=Darwinula stevensoni TaxID=69355 RepID=A0A7R9A852_9CRUS|nr:unnamed protein product [Darwinula stevensoni]CAG0895487.1 unnamed protein product [Darwinula stevensoni]